MVKRSVMTSPLDINIREITWAHIFNAVRINSCEETESHIIGDELSVVVRLFERFQARKARDWLHKEIGGEYRLEGYFRSFSASPFAARFTFNDMDTKVLFGLRWL